MPGSKAVVQCSSCRRVTEVDEEAAQTLESLRPKTFGLSMPSTAPSPSSSSRRQDVSALTGSQEFPSSHMSPQGSSVDTLPSRVQLPQRPQAQTVTWSQAFMNPEWDGSATASMPGSGASTPAGPVPLRNGNAAQSTLPTSRSHSPSTLLKPPRPVRFCGQCEDKSADLLCEQCDELFCRGCAAAIHRRGQMARHNLRPHILAKETQGSMANGIGNAKGGAYGGVSELGDVSPMGNFIGPGHPDPVPFVRKFLRCPAHPEEPLQFFCLTCESECICAECALHGEHRQHDVLNLREACRRLPEKAAELLASARLRAEELTGIGERVKLDRRSLSEIVAQSKKQLRSLFEQVRLGLLAEERALLQEVQQCAAEVTDILQAEELVPETHIHAAHAALQKHHSAGDAVMALNAYVSLKKHLSVPPPAFDAGLGVADLKQQLQRGFDSRVAGLTRFAENIEQLPKAELQGAHDVRSPEVKAAVQFGGPGRSVWGFGDAAVLKELDVGSPRSAAAEPLKTTEHTKFRPTAHFGTQGSPRDQVAGFGM